MIGIAARRALLAAACLAVALAPAAARAQADKVRISFNPQTHSYLPLFVAIEKGFFKDQKLDVDYVTYTGSALSQIPMLARGDLDIAPMVTGPAFFNQYAEGFGVKLVASLAQGKAGWHDTTWLMIRKDLWDAGTIKGYADLKGRAVEIGPKGSPIYLTTTQALQQGGLTLKDVMVSERMRALSDGFPLFRNKAVDVMALAEPIAGRIAAEGLAVRWKASNEVMPWFQESYLAATTKFLTEKRDVTKRFLAAYLKGAQAVTAAGGKWTPELAGMVAKLAKLPVEDILKIPGPQHVGQYGKIELGSIARLQDIWIAEGMVKTKTPLADLVDTSIIDEVRKDLGIR